MVCAKGGEGFDFGAVGIVAGHFLQIGEIFGIHGEDEVEIVEVGGLKMPGAAHDRVATFCEGGGHAFVGSFAGVVIMGASGVTGKAMGKSGAARFFAENDLGGGRAADVAKADEKDFIHGPKLT